MKDIYWKAHSFKYSKKKTDWYWITWSIASLIIFSLYYFGEDMFFAFIVFLVAILITIGSFKKPTVNKYSLEEEALVIDDHKRILFSDIKSYNIDPDNLLILINTTKTLQPLIHIPFEATQNISKIDVFLSSKTIKDPELKIPFLEIIVSRILGF